MPGTVKLQAITSDKLRKRILLIDDHVVLRQGLRRFLDTSPDLVVCAEAGNKQQALRAADAFGPDVVITDLFLGEESTLGLIREMTRRRSDLPVLVFTMHDELVYRARVEEAGARAWISKTEPPEAVLSAIRRVVANSFLSRPSAQAATP